MNKTIRFKEEMNFRELMEYILENDIRDREFRSRGHEYRFSVCEDGIFDFYCENYNIGETYEVEVEKEITEDTMFNVLIEIYGRKSTITHECVSIKEIKESITERIYALIDGELQLIWGRE